MARKYSPTDFDDLRLQERRNAFWMSGLASAGAFGLAASPLLTGLDPSFLFGLGALPALAFVSSARTFADHALLERERKREFGRRQGRPVLGMPPQRDCLAQAIAEARAKGKSFIDKYLVGFELDTGRPLWVSDDDICTHGCVFAKTGVGKTLWLESLMLQQMARGRASGLTFIDAKRDSTTLAHIILMALITGRIEDLIVIDPFNPVHSYNFVLTNQRSDVKARKVLRAGLPAAPDGSVIKHYDRLAADSVYRMVRALESIGLAWSIRDVVAGLRSFNIAYPKLRTMLQSIGARRAMVDLGHLAASYRNIKGTLDTTRLTDNLRGIASELDSIASSDLGFCENYTDLVLTEAISRGKIIYFMLPRLEEAESANRMMKLFREDLEVSIGEITSRDYTLEDPHLVIIDEGSSTFGPTWANLFELARRGRFALLFGAQSTGALTDHSLGLSQAFYERVMANVNLKVMMRVGDNRTASEMTEWIGKVTSTQKSVRTAGADSTLFGKNESSVTTSERDEDLVSSEELKHEMSSEKGLAWFDLGDGKIVKGRSFWFDPQIPESWNGRKFIPKLERYTNDGVGLADWIDEQVLTGEGLSDAKRPTPEGGRREDVAKLPEPAPGPGGVFRVGSPKVKKGAAPTSIVKATKPDSDPSGNTSL